MTDKIDALIKIASAATPGEWECREGDYVGFLGEA